MAKLYGEGYGKKGYVAVSTKKAYGKGEYSGKVGFMQGKHVGRVYQDRMPMDNKSANSIDEATYGRATWMASDKKKKGWK